jgi:hypothetical protein
MRGFVYHLSLPPLILSTSPSHRITTPPPSPPPTRQPTTMRSTLLLASLSLLAPSLASDCNGGFGVASNPGDTCESFAKQWKITVDELKRLNPDVTCPELEYRNDTYCVRESEKTSSGSDSSSSSSAESVLVSTTTSASATPTGVISGSASGTTPAASASGSAAPAQSSAAPSGSSGAEALAVGSYGLVAGIAGVFALL